MLSAILQKVTGMTVLDYLRPRLFEPLGIESPTWGTNPQGITLGGFGLSVRTEDIARFGQLYLQRASGRAGNWFPPLGSKRLPQANLQWQQSKERLGSRLRLPPWRCRNGIYRGDGAFGQFCIVMQELDAVIAITAGTRDMQAVLISSGTSCFRHSTKTASADPESLKKASTELAGLVLHPQKGSGLPGPAAIWSGKKFSFPANDEKDRSGGARKLVIPPAALALQWRQQRIAAAAQGEVGQGAIVLGLAQCRNSRLPRAGLASAMSRDICRETLFL